MEYSTYQKERIANQLLEFYKDGKYAFDEEKKRQSQTHYNKKSEIMRSIDKWCKTEDIAKWIIPILDYNLETSYEELEKEWDKNHRLAIKVEDWENKYHYMEQHLEQEAKRMMKEKMDVWVSEKEDVAKLHEELEEMKNRKSEMLRRHTRSMNLQAQENQRLLNCVQKMEDELREKRTEDAEKMLSDKEEMPSLKKSVKRLENQNTKLEKETLKLQKQKMEGDVRYLELKTKTDSIIADMKTELEKAKLQTEYYKIKDSVKVQSPPQPLQQHPQVEEVVLGQE